MAEKYGKKMYPYTVYKLYWCIICNLYSKLPCILSHAFDKHTHTHIRSNEFRNLSPLLRYFVA